MSSSIEELQAENSQLRQRVAALEQQAQESKYAVFFNKASDLFCIAGFDGYFKHLNPQWEKTLGFTIAELLAQPFVTFVHPTDQELTLANVHSLLEGHETATFEILCGCQDGSSKSLIWKIAAELDQQLIYGVGRDITEYKRLEVELRQSKLMLQGIIDNAPAIIYAKTLDRRLFAFNRQFATFMGLPPAELLGKTGYDLFPPAVADLFQAHEDQILATGQPQTEERELVVDGTPRVYWEVKFPIFDDEGQIVSLGGFATDITPRRRIEEEVRKLNAALEQQMTKRTAELQENQSLFQSIINNSPSIIYAKDLQWRIILANQPYSDLINVPIDQVVGKNDYDLFPAEAIDPIRKNDEKIIAEGKPISIEEYLELPDGLHTYISFKFPLYDTEGVVCGLGGISTDITAQKRVEAERADLQEQVIEAQRSALRELSAPLIPLADEVLAMPLIGKIDAQRVQNIMETLLEGIVEHQAAVAILDVTGLKQIDTQVAQALLQTIQAVKLLGAEVILTGISATLAQTLVQLGLDLSGVSTHSTLQAGVEAALERK